MNTNTTKDFINWYEILKNFTIAPIKKLTPVGGTSLNPKISAIDTNDRKFVCRRLPYTPDQLSFAEFDHKLRTYLFENHFPTPELIKTKDGTTILKCNNHLYELSTFVDGKPIAILNKPQLLAVANLLARFHILGKNFRHPGKDKFPPEDQPCVLTPILRNLEKLSPTDEEKNSLNLLQNALEHLWSFFENYTSKKYELSVIHGDFHPGNLLFIDDKISALLDYDYSSYGNVLRDIADGLMFFAADRETPFNTDNIWSLTQRWHLNPFRFELFLKKYLATNPILIEPVALANFMKLRWFQCKIRGTRKVPTNQKLKFVFTDLWKLINHIDNQILPYLEQFQL